MGRYTGPKRRLSRREGIALTTNDVKAMEKGAVAPGQHGGKMRRRVSEYGVQLREKQKAKRLFGIMEKQFKGYVVKASKVKGATGLTLLENLETRLDNVVYRLGFAKTRYMARQFVTHGHILVNDKRLNIPSYSVKVDDVISISVKMQKNPRVLDLFKEEMQTLPYLDKQGVSGKLVRMPKSEDLQVPFDLQLIIEYYSR